MPAAKIRLEQSVTMCGETNAGKRRTLAYLSISRSNQEET